MAMHPNHKRQQEESIVRSLSKAGIPRTFHKRSLSDVDTPEAHRMLAFVKHGSREPNRGVSFIGEQKADHLLILTARGLHMAGRPVRIMTLWDMHKQLERDRWSFLDEIETVSTIGIRQAGPQPGIRGDGETFTRYQLAEIDRVISAWVDDGHRILIHCPTRLAETGWFSRDLIHASGRGSRSGLQGSRSRRRPTGVRTAAIDLGNASIRQAVQHLAQYQLALAAAPSRCVLFDRHAIARPA